VPVVSVDRLGTGHTQCVDDDNEVTDVEGRVNGLVFCRANGEQLRWLLIRGPCRSRQSQTTRAPRQRVLRWLLSWDFSIKEGCRALFCGRRSSDGTS
jgi:hypothetical protein